MEEFRYLQVGEGKMFEFSPMQEFQNEEKREHKIEEIEQRMERGFRKLDERCRAIEDDLGDILLICKETILVK